MDGQALTENQNHTNEYSSQSVVQSHDEVTAVSRLIEDAIESVKLTNRLSKILLYVSSYALIITIVFIVIIFFAFKSDNKYFAATPDGTITPMIALDKPVINDNGIKLFTRDTLYDVMNLDFDKYREDIEKGRVGFTDKGLSNFIAALKDSGIIEIMNKERVNIRTEFDTPIISRKGIKEGIAHWNIQIPIVIKFVGQNTYTKPLKFNLLVTIIAVDTKQSPKGVAIDQVVTKPAN